MTWNEILGVLQARRQHDKMTMMIDWCSGVYLIFVIPTYLLRRTLILCILVIVTLPYFLYVNPVYLAVSVASEGIMKS